MDVRQRPSERKCEQADAAANAPAILRWNRRQMQIFRRYGRLFGVVITAETVAPLAVRYAEKHATTRPRLLMQRQVA